jgi:hypothetical protein
MMLNSWASTSRSGTPDHSPSPPEHSSTRLFAACRNVLPIFPQALSEPEPSCSRGGHSGTTNAGPARRNPVRLGSYVSRAMGASGDCGLSAGVLATGPGKDTLVHLERGRG